MNNIEHFTKSLYEFSKNLPLAFKDATKEFIHKTSVAAYELNRSAFEKIFEVTDDTKAYINHLLDKNFCKFRI